MKQSILSILHTLVITDAMIAAAKEKWGADAKLATLSLVDDGDGNGDLESSNTELEGKTTLDVIIRVPDRQTLGEYEKWQGTDPNKARYILINACLLTFKDQVKADDRAFYTCNKAICDLIPIGKSVIKNL